MSQFIQTYQSGWSLLRSITGADTAITELTKNFAAKPSAAVELPRNANSVSIMGFGEHGSAAEDKNPGNFILYGWRPSGPAMHLMTVGGNSNLTGGVDVLDSPTGAETYTTLKAKYIENFNITVNNVSPAAVQCDNGNDRVSTIQFDLHGIRHLYAEFSATIATTATHLGYAFF